jgi:hypothetical protein
MVHVRILLIADALHLSFIRLEGDTVAFVENSAGNT